MKNKTKLRRTAYHEAGHAAVAWWADVEVHAVSIVPDTDKLGSTLHANPVAGISLDLDESPDAIDRAEKVIMICFAGGIAEKRASPRARWRHGCSSDFAQAGQFLMRIGGDDDEHRKHYERLLWRRTEIRVHFLWPQIAFLARRLLKDARLDAAGVLEELRRLPTRRHRFKRPPKSGEGP